MTQCPIQNNLMLVKCETAQLLHLMVMHETFQWTAWHWNMRQQHNYCISWLPSLLFFVRDLTQHSESLLQCAIQIWVRSDQASWKAFFFLLQLDCIRLTVIQLPTINAPSLFELCGFWSFGRSTSTVQPSESFCSLSISAWAVCSGALANLSDQ